MQSLQVSLAMTGWKNTLSLWILVFNDSSFGINCIWCSLYALNKHTSVCAHTHELPESIMPGKLLLATLVKESENTSPEPHRKTAFSLELMLSHNWTIFHFHSQRCSHTQREVYLKKALGEQPIPSKQYLSKQTVMTQTLKHEVLKENIWIGLGLFPTTFYSVHEADPWKRKGGMHYTLRDMQKKSCVHASKQKHSPDDKELKAKQKLRGRIGRRQDRSLK